MKQRFVEYDNKQLKDALISFLNLDKERNVIDTLTFKNNKEAGLDFLKRVEDFSELILNNGFDVETQKKMSLQDLSNEIDASLRDFKESTGKDLIKDFSSSSLGFFAQQIINRLVTKIQVEDLEAWKFVSKDLLLEDATVFYTLVLGETGGPATSRVAESGEFKTLNLESSEDFIKTSKGKVGVYVSLTEEALQRNGVALFNSLIAAAINDMKRYKSMEALRLLEQHAKTYYDGLATTNPTLFPSGRSRKNPTVHNGTLLLGDLEKFLHEAQTNAFNIDVIFMHPLAWNVFMKEPNIKTYLKETANIHFMIPKKVPTVAGNQITKWKRTLTGNVPQQEGKLEVPQLISNKNLNIIVTPLVSFFPKGSTVNTPLSRFTTNPITQYQNISNSCADIILCDSARALTHVHDGKGITSDKVEDKLVDVTKIKFKERYSFVLDKDHGVFAFRNINSEGDIFDPDTITPVLTIEDKEIFPRS